ncbi:MAG: ornithine carbamoyltransferase [Syntrophus sp. (in: bacteria)]|nr:ornithine carbamoyltransferase [Syntrophus sp. (in: bacteria)]
MDSKRDFTKLRDISREEGQYLLERAHFLKRLRKEGKPYKPLADKSLAMIFEKASTRTRASFEIGMWELGGYAMFLNTTETQIGRGEPVKDTARVLSRYVDAIMIRTYAQSLIEELALWSTVPLINGLSDLYHPCQTLADLLTIEEFKGAFERIKIAYIGDGNNVANSWLEASILFGLDFAIATPEHYEPETALLAEARENGRFTFTHDPFDAVKDADVVYTDVWVSMGQEKEQEERVRVFDSYKIDEKLMKNARKDAIVMHCLPAYRNKEISDEIFEKHEKVIFAQAENRLHCQKALLEWLILRQC